jgi:hypothetical protein
VSVSIDDIPQPARMAWLRLRDELHGTLGEDLVAIWAHGGKTSLDGPPRSGDLDTYVILRRRPDEEAVRHIEDAHEEIARTHEIEWDAWYILVDDARRPGDPRHAYREERRDTSWAVNRAHLLAGRYVQLYGPEPEQIVPPPTWPELERDLRREVEHLERHVLEGDTDPYEASYAILNGSRVVHSLDTRSVAISKVGAGAWAQEHLPDRWHPTLRAAGRAYEGQATPDDMALIAAEMAPFVAMVRERLPARETFGHDQP